jgi:hypothetical protein
VNALPRRLAAALVAMALLALIACDQFVSGFPAWWDRHSLTGSIVSSLLVLAVTALIVDEVVARRQRRERAVSVAVQGLIVYGQARRVYDSMKSTSAPEELGTLASMLLTASSSLFDDPEARLLLEQLQRFAALMYRAVIAPSKGAPSTVNGQQLASAMSGLQAAVQPLLGRISAEDRASLEGDSQA